MRNSWLRRKPRTLTFSRRAEPRSAASCPIRQLKDPGRDGPGSLAGSSTRSRTRMICSGRFINAVTRQPVPAPAALRGSTARASFRTPETSGHRRDRDLDPFQRRRGEVPEHARMHRGAGRCLRRAERGPRRQSRALGLPGPLRAWRCAVQPQVDGRGHPETGHRGGPHRFRYRDLAEAGQQHAPG